MKGGTEKSCNNSRAVIFSSCRRTVSMRYHFRQLVDANPFLNKLFFFCFLITTKI